MKFLSNFTQNYLIMKFRVYLIISAFLVTAFQLKSQDYRLLLANQTIEQQQIENKIELGSNIEGLSSLNGFYYGLIQFNNLPDRLEVERLKTEGVELLDYMPSNAYYVKISVNYSISNYSNIRLVYNLKYKDKLRSDLLKAPFPRHAVQNGNLKLIVQAISNDDLGLIAEQIEARKGKVTSIDGHIQAVYCELPIHELRAFSNLAFVQFVVPIDAPGFPENFKGKNGHRVNSLTKNYTGLSKDLNGEGMNVMLQDDGVIGPHIDYKGRIGAQFLTSNRGDHGDHTGGTIMAAGNLEPRYQGMAPASQLWVYGAAPAYPGFDSIYSHYIKYDIRITSTSYSNGVNAGYSPLAQKLDDQTEKMNDLIHVFSAGNSRGASGNGWYTITGGHKVAKNVITVANLDLNDNDANSSSQGPTKDGRIKPDIGAVGSNVMSTSNPNRYVSKSGTSMSCPGVAGSITVLCQAYKELNSGNTVNAALMKAIVCNTADDLGRKGPDFTHGFGRINARKAYDVIKNKTYYKDSISTNGTKTFNVTAGNNDRLLKVMVVWLDPQGTVGSSRPLVNDLDVTVSTGSLSPVKPLILDPLNPAGIAKNGRDSINNIEQVVIETLTPGTYTITVIGKSIPKGPQEFYVVYSFESDGIIVEYPVGGESLVPIEEEMIRWSDAGNNGPYSLEYSIDNGGSWNTITNVSSSARFFNWTVPNLPSSKALVRVSGTGTSGVSSNNFSIFKVPTSLAVDYACPDSVGLKWDSTSSASHYVIYELGAKYMDSIGTSATNVFNLLGNCSGSKEGWFAVSARGTRGEIGRRSRAFYKDDKLKNCTIKNDIALVKINPSLGRVTSCAFPNGVKVGVEVKNNSSSVSSVFTLNLTVNGGIVIQENAAKLIPAGSSDTIIFQNSITLNNGINKLVVWQSSVGDQNACNDSLFAESEFVNETAKPSCFTNNFDDFAQCTRESNCETGFCDLSDGWYNPTNGEADDIDWRVTSTGTPSRNTGPNSDHTLGNATGRYLYLESSTCVEKEAFLVSPCYDLKSAVKPELTFWYHMNGANMGVLELDVFADGKWDMNVMLTLSGNKGNRWIEQKVDLLAYKGKVINIRFRGKTANGFAGDMALDDIGITDTVTADFSTTQKTALLIDFANLSSGASNSKWDFGDGDTSSSASPSHTYKKAGVYQIKLIINGDCGKDSISKSIEVNLTGIEQYSELLREVKVYPQPAAISMLIESVIEIYELRILDLSGKQVLINTSSFTTKEIYVENLENGIYILELKAGDTVSRRKIEILR
jgi:hypothetical protein